jgi:ribonuclease BN (tRNA processing enzyme)
LFLSHFHLDHLAGLHIMAKFRFKQGIMIVGQKGTKKILAQLLRQPFTLALKDLKTKVTVREVNGGNKRFPILEAALKLKHVSSCFGFRFRLQDKVIAFVPDTGVCDNAYRLAGGADLLIAECAFAPGQKSDDWPHLNPESGAKIAKETGARRLALVHFDAEIYKTLAQRARAGKIARRIFPRTVVTRDGMVLTLK